jgi:hypothetical protein
MSSHSIDFSQYEAKPTIDFSKYEAAPQAPEPAGFWDTLGREGKSLAGNIAGIPAAVYHAFSDPPTAEEKAKFGAEEVAGPKRVGLGIHRLAIAPVETAADWYSDALRGNIPSAYEQALSVAPEAMGVGAAAAITPKIASEVPGAVGAATDAAAESIPKAVRAGARAANTVLDKAPGSVGTAVGAAAGHATGLPGAAVIGGAVGNALGKELLPQVRIPGEGFGLPNRVTGGPVNIADWREPDMSSPSESPAAPAPNGQTAPPAPAVSPGQGAGESIPRTLAGDAALRKILTGQDNANLLKIARSRGIDVTSEAQLKPGVADSKIINKIIDDFGDDELQEVRDKYVETKRFQHQFSPDVGPEFWKTVNLKTYFPDLKIPAAVEKRVAAAAAKSNITPPPGYTPIGTVPEDLTDILQQSLAAAKKAKP